MIKYKCWICFMTLDINQHTLFLWLPSWCLSSSAEPELQERTDECETRNCSLSCCQQTSASHNKHTNIFLLFWCLCPNVTSGDQKWSSRFFRSVNGLFLSCKLRKWKQTWLKVRSWWSKHRNPITQVLYQLQSSIWATTDLFNNRLPKAVRTLYLFQGQHW